MLAPFPLQPLPLPTIQHIDFLGHCYFRRKRGPRHPLFRDDDDDEDEDEDEDDIPNKASPTYIEM